MSAQNNDIEIRRMKDRISDLEGEMSLLKTTLGNMRWAFIWFCVVFILYVWVSR